jgi:hypothetical protein
MWGGGGVVYDFFSREKDSYEMKEIEKAMVDRRITLFVAQYQQQQ